MGILERGFSPVNRGLQAVGEIGKEVTSTVGNVFSRGVNGVRRVGRSATGRVNQGLGELVGSRKKHRGGRRNRNRKATRKASRKVSRKNRKNRH